MSEVFFTTNKIPSREELLELYRSVEWSRYTADPDTLVKGVVNSLRVATAWSEDGELIGLARVVGDGHTIAYLQDVLVRPRWQRSGVGKWLVREVFAPYSHVRQQVLLTDDEPRQRAFYESMGFVEIRDEGEGHLRAYIRHGA